MTTQPHSPTPPAQPVPGTDGVCYLYAADRELCRLPAGHEQHSSRAQPPAQPVTDDLDYYATDDAALEQFQERRDLREEDWYAYFTGWGDAIHNVHAALDAERTTATAQVAERVKELEGALWRIHEEYGQVCQNYELCTHRACASSYGAWATADEALMSLATPPPPTEASDAHTR